MPIYEYKCNNCKRIIEVLLSINDGEKNKMLKCEYCSSLQLMTKQISLSDFKLVGRGWGKDGYYSTYEQAKDAI